MCVKMTGQGQTHTVQVSYSNSPCMVPGARVFLCLCWHIVKLWWLQLSGYEMKDCSAEPHSSDVFFFFFFKDHMYLSLTSKTVPLLCLSRQPSSSHTTINRVPRREQKRKLSQSFSLGGDTEYSSPADFGGCRQTSSHPHAFPPEHTEEGMPLSAPEEASLVKARVETQPAEFRAPFSCFLYHLQWSWPCNIDLKGLHRHWLRLVDLGSGWISQQELECDRYTLSNPLEKSRFKRKMTEIWQMRGKKKRAKSLTYTKFFSAFSLKSVHFTQ